MGSQYFSAELKSTVNKAPLTREAGEKLLDLFEKSELFYPVNISFSARSSAASFDPEDEEVDYPEYTPEIKEEVLSLICENNLSFLYLSGLPFESRKSNWQAMFLFFNENDIVEIGNDDGQENGFVEFISFTHEYYYNNESAHKIFMDLFRGLAELQDADIGTIDDLAKSEELMYEERAIHWGNYFGKGLCELYGKQKILSVPAYTVEEWDTGVFFSLTGSCLTFDTKDAKKRRKTVGKYLGIKAPRRRVVSAPFSLLGKWYPTGSHLPFSPPRPGSKKPPRPQRPIVFR